MFKFYTIILSIIVFITSTGVCFADIYVFPGKNVVKGNVTVVSQQNNFDNYIKKAYHNPNVTQEREQLEIKKQSLDAQKRELEAYQERTKVLNKSRYSYRKHRNYDNYLYDFTDADFETNSSDNSE